MFVKNITPFHQIKIPLFQIRKHSRQLLIYEKNLTIRAIMCHTRCQLEVIPPPRDLTHFDKSWIPVPSPSLYPQNDEFA